jgi:hypothetical protein
MISHLMAGISSISKMGAEANTLYWVLLMCIICIKVQNNYSRTLWTNKNRPAPFSRAGATNSNRKPRSEGKKTATKQHADPPPRRPPRPKQKNKHKVKSSKTSSRKARYADKFHLPKAGGNSQYTKNGFPFALILDLKNAIPKPKGSIQSKGISTAARSLLLFLALIVIWENPIASPPPPNSPHHKTSHNISPFLAQHFPPSYDWTTTIINPQPRETVKPNSKNTSHCLLNDPISTNQNHDIKNRRHPNLNTDFDQLTHTPPSPPAEGANHLQGPPPHQNHQPAACKNFRRMTNSAMGEGWTQIAHAEYEVQFQVNSRSHNHQNPTNHIKNANSSSANKNTTKGTQFGTTVNGGFSIQPQSLASHIKYLTTPPSRTNSV